MASVPETRHALLLAKARTTTYLAREADHDGARKRRNAPTRSLIAAAGLRPTNTPRDPLPCLECAGDAVCEAGYVGTGNQEGPLTLATVSEVSRQGCGMRKCFSVRRQSRGSYFSPANFAVHAYACRAWRRTRRASRGPTVSDQRRPGAWATVREEEDCVRMGEICSWSDVLRHHASFSAILGR